MTSVAAPDRETHPIETADPWARWSRHVLAAATRRRLQKDAPRGVCAGTDDCFVQQVGRNDIFAGQGVQVRDVPHQSAGAWPCHGHAHQATVLLGNPGPLPPRTVRK